MYDEKIGHTHFWMNFVGTNLAYLPMFLAGLLGMPRRVADYDPSFASYNQLATLGALILARLDAALPVQRHHQLAHGPKAAANPWRGLTLEWQTSVAASDEELREIPP